MLPRLRTLIAVVVATAALAVLATEIISGARAYRPSSVREALREGSLFDERIDWNQFANPENARLFALITAPSQPEERADRPEPQESESLAELTPAPPDVAGVPTAESTPAQNLATNAPLANAAQGGPYVPVDLPPSPIAAGVAPMADAVSPVPPSSTVSAAAAAAAVPPDPHPADPDPLQLSLATLQDAGIHQVTAPAPALETPEARRVDSDDTAPLAPAESTAPGPSISVTAQAPAATEPTEIPKKTAALAAGLPEIGQEAAASVIGIIPLPKARPSVAHARKSAARRATHRARLRHTQPAVAAQSQPAPQDPFAGLFGTK